MCVDQEVDVQIQKEVIRVTAYQDSNRHPDRFVQVCKYYANVIYYDDK